MKILVTAFEPFDGDTVNSSREAVRLLPEVIAGAEIIRLELPVVFGEAGDVLEEAVRRHRPDAVICTGQAGSSTELRVERVAINLRDARIPDNKGCQPVDEKICEAGQNAYFASIPVKAIVSAIQVRGIPAVLSCSAGTFVCNDVMYRLLHMIDTEYPRMKGGFIHFPYLPEQAEVRSGQKHGISAESMTSALEAGIEAIISA